MKSLSFLTKHIPHHLSELIIAHFGNYLDVGRALHSAKLVDNHLAPGVRALELDCTVMLTDLKHGAGVEGDHHPTRRVGQIVAPPPGLLLFVYGRFRYSPPKFCLSRIPRLVFRYPILQNEAYRVQFRRVRSLMQFHILIICSWGKAKERWAPGSVINFVIYTFIILQTQCGRYKYLYSLNLGSKML